ncbi:MAG: carboxylating nicotinate-nucleotide diphosphorylase [Planctomycetota bacterium]
MDPSHLERALDDLVRRALAEDLGIDVTPSTSPDELIACDVTTRTAVPRGARGRATLIAKEAGVFAGGGAFARALRFVDPEAVVDAAIGDGTTVVPGDVVLHATGSARALLVAERTALNIVQRMSGIATRTREAVDLVEGTGVRILDTRKTTPGMRALDKFAVRIGGGDNHRMGLFDEAMVKENHVDLAGRTIEEVLADIRADVGPDVTITCEARDGAEAEAAVRGGADVVLLDNMSADVLTGLCPRLRALSDQRGAPVLLEASGGITHATLRAVAGSGIDRISMGALTHSAPALDLSLDLSFDLPYRTEGEGEDGSAEAAPASSRARGSGAEVVRGADAPGKLDLELPSTHAHGRMARRIARQFAESEGLPTPECETLEFVAGELLDNAIDHGGGGAARDLADLEGDVRIHFAVDIEADGDAWRWAVRVEDQGGGEPDEVRRLITPPDGIPDLEDERGRGFYLLAQMVDELDVVRSEDGRGLRFEATRAADRAAG